MWLLLDVNVVLAAHREDHPIAISHASSPSIIAVQLPTVHDQLRKAVPVPIQVGDSKIGTPGRLWTAFGSLAVY